MHIPDGFLSVLVSVVLWLVSALVVAYALKRVGEDLGERQLPMMGVLAAAIFAGQMLNFTVAGGTSGHLIGAALATILLGPWAAVLVMTSVISIQALIFQDGGLLVLGANIFNMGILAVAVAYAVYRTVRALAANRRWGLLAGGFLSAWASVVVTALAVALQLALSGTSPANIAIPTMGLVHVLIGIGEGLITSGALAFLYGSRRDLLEAGQAQPAGGRAVWIFGLLAALALTVLSPLASSHPDGLMWFAQQQGFLSAARSPLYRLLPGYLLPGVSNQAAATILAGVLGVLIVFAVTLLVGLLGRKRSSEQE
jgi:cobalt/nickel transport system permease protein